MPSFLLPYKARDKGDIRLAEPGPGRGHGRERPLTQADTMNPLLVGLMLGTLPRTALGKKTGKAPVIQAGPSLPAGRPESPGPALLLPGHRMQSREQRAGDHLW